MSKNILIVAAHADDEALGCGGAIAKHAATGDVVYAVFMTDGVSSRGDSGSEAQRRRDSAAAASGILGLKDSLHLAFPDNRMDSVPLLDIVQAVEEVVRKFQPDIIYTHHAGDLNIDHRITHQAVMTACRPMPGSSVREIYAFEVLSSTDWATPDQRPFLPNAYVDISDFLAVKLHALDAYADEMREPHHSRSRGHVKALAEHRGNSMGVAAAEAFYAVRIIR